jgi:Lhr-like helicase
VKALYARRVKMEREQRSDRFTAIEDRFAGYTVYDNNHEKIGKVDNLFVDARATSPST